ncbi:hypothetical protein [Halomarina oriensis]|uniref:Uncharacterized protein n=1 Tax=Halomarina oriensis TaxID=671145 RepID=A0A6B0GWR2_9EURY|nr:hypothetical protein [Halomarina oriensis]MWG36585.1 hypothetical protein [Halomarina oriensis]
MSEPSYPRDVRETFVPFRYGEPERLALDQFQQAITNRQDFAFEDIELFSWPGQRLDVSFTYSPPAARWLWEVVHRRPTREDVTLVDAPAVIHRPYRYRDVLVFTFRYTGQVRPQKVDASNLGRRVELVCYPGPESEAFPFDLSEA